MKKSSFLSLSLLILLSVCSYNLFAEIKLPAIFSDRMVLQQTSDVAIWGEASANSKVTVITSWNKKAYTTTSSKEGVWKLKLSTPKAGGPYNISISDGAAMVLKDILIGEVWLCSGQSNMEMPMKGFYNQPILGSAEAIATADNPAIHLFTVKRNTSLTPLADVKGEWLNCNSETVAEFSATAYYFGLMLNKKLGVPIGLISSNWGGTVIEPWISEMGIKNFDWVKLPEKKPIENLSPQVPTVLFNAMINPLVGYAMRGVIWYQGESNRNDAKGYQKLLPGLIKDWRTLWGIGDFPFYYVQIAPYNYGGRGGESSAYLREAQLNVSNQLPNIGMVSLMDIGEEHIIHPAHKELGSQRLAYLALEKTYGIKGIQSGSPVFKEMKADGAIAKLTFDNAPNGLTSYSKKLGNFEIAGADQKFYPADAVISRTGVDVSSSSVKEPVAVRYAFKDFVVGDLFGLNGNPVSSFRTDDWK